MSPKEKPVVNIPEDSSPSIILSIDPQWYEVGKPNEKLVSTVKKKMNSSLRISRVKKRRA
ncbi:MAG TPA: hypothetical protein VE978_24255 [Chitinophagales bacterium]|nr:hypothetical protein [Chitinophagales bacterium]